MVNEHAGDSDYDGDASDHDMMWQDPEWYACITVSTTPIESSLHGIKQKASVRVWEKI